MICIKVDTGKLAYHLVSEGKTEGCGADLRDGADMWGDRMQTIATLDGKPISINSNGTWSFLPPQGPALEQMQSAEVPKSMAELLAGIFDRVGVCVEDTGERVIVEHKGDHFEFVDGSDGAPADYDLTVNSYQVSRLIENTRNGYADPVARFGLVRVFLEALPFTVDSLLNNGFLVNPVFRKLIKAKDLIHIVVESPTPKDQRDSLFTLFFVNNAWHVAEGLIGKPERVFRMSPDDALEFMRIGFGAKDAGIVDLPGGAARYIEWRKKVEVAPK